MTAVALTTTLRIDVEHALAYRAAGISLVPVGRNKKAYWPALPRDADNKPVWEPFQHQMADEETVRGWFQHTGVTGVAGVGGAISGGLLVLDFDEERFYHAWIERVGDLVNNLPVQRTGGGGYQVWLRCDDPGRNAELAWIINEAEKTGRSIAIETRAEGGYALLPGSAHPSGGAYEVLDGDFTNVPRVSMDVVNVLLDEARKLDECPLTRQQRARAARAEIKGRTVATTSGGHEDTDENDDVIGKFNAAVPMREMLERCGYKRHSGDRYTRPGEGAAPGGLFIFDDNRCFAHSTNDALHDGYAHDSFSVFYALCHDGDMKEAIKAAARELGLPPRKKKNNTTSAQSAVLPEYEGPLGLKLGLQSAREVGKFGKVEVTFTVTIAGKAQAPVTVTTSTNGTKEAARILEGWVARAHDRERVTKNEAIEIQQFMWRTMSDAPQMVRISREHEKSHPDARADAAGPLMQQIVMDKAPVLAGLAFVNRDGTIWSESMGRNIDRREFESAMHLALVEACLQAADYPSDYRDKSAPVGRIKSYLPMAWTEALKKLPSEVNADLGPASKAGQRLEDAIVNLFNIRERWRKVFRADSSEYALDSATLAQLAREKINNLPPTQPSGWIRCHNSAIDAWVCLTPKQGPNGESTGEEADVWLAIRVELPSQLPRSSRPELPNIRNQIELGRVAKRYGLTADGEPHRPTIYLRERGAKAIRVLVLSRKLTDRIMFRKENDENIEEVLLREGATADLDYCRNG